MTSFFRAITGATALVFSLTAAAQIIYPAQGQSPELQQRDQSECQVWATQNTGIDPVVLAQTPPAQYSSTGGGERVKGAGMGALGGLAIGAIAGNGGKGAAIGAVTGTMIGGRQARQNKAASQQYDQAQRQQMMDTWSRAVGVCMTGRGYTVG